ncbi:HTH-type transcriptional regulator NorG [Thalassocella blandensis]|nr:HTH-type transcriptional regulator NorG [Thalassocella blandensis]
MKTLYQQLARELVQEIESGAYCIGEKMPGIRATSNNKRVSPSTAVAAYRQLELDGYIESRPRSGFYVAHRRRRDVEEPQIENLVTEKPGLVEGQRRVLQLISQINNPNITQFGAGVPDSSFLPLRAMEKALAHAVKFNRIEISSYSKTLGEISLRKQLARRMSQIGCLTHHDDIIVTSGCQEAVHISLKMLTQPGDIVAVESPTFHGHLQTIDALGLKALEIPTHPREGISLEALQLAFDQWPIKACIVIPNFSNPLGSCMSDANKAALAKLCHKAKVPIIEDDIYGDVSFSQQRPSTVKSFDSSGNVIYCSSFSKTISPGMRVGWVSSAKYLDKLEYQKFVTNVSAPGLQQLALASMLRSGMYDKHLRFIRGEIEKSVDLISERIIKTFPLETKITQPSGGYFLWLELPENVDAFALVEAALKHNISIAPGPIFSAKASAKAKFSNYIRISCAVLWNDKTRKAIDTLGEIINAHAQ